MTDADIKLELVQKIHQYFTNELKSNPDLSEAAQESLTVVVECIETAYKLNKQSQNEPSNDLLDIYKNYKQEIANRQNQSSSPHQTSSARDNPFQNINLPSLMSQFASVFNQNAGGSTNPQPESQRSNSNANTSADPPTSDANKQPKDRKKGNEADKKEAETLKNQGNEYMKQEKFKEAYDCYTKAIELDGNNAVYYSNRAAALSKLGDHHAALRDCEEAIEIDPTYSKAYGRMGLAYVSLNDHQKGRDAYVKAVELDPDNESYKNNLSIAEERLRAGNSGPGSDQNIMDSIRRIMADPESLRNVMSAVQSPEVQETVRAFCGFTMQQFANMGRNNQPPPGTS